jgi:hypothetical protein
MQQSNISTLSLFAICLFLLLLLMRTCAALGEAESNAMYLDSLNNEYAVRIARDSSKMHSQGVQLAAAGTKLRALELREPEVVIRYQTRTKVVTQVELGETVYIDSFPHMRLPRYFHRPGKWLEIGGQINRLGRLQLDSIIIPVSYTVAIGDTLRKGFLSRKRDKVVRLGIDNPYVTVTGMNNIIVAEPPKKWWQTNAAKVGLGALIGFGIARTQN